MLSSNTTQDSGPIIKRTGFNHKSYTIGYNRGYKTGYKEGYQKAIEKMKEILQPKGE